MKKNYVKVDVQVMHFMKEDVLLVSGKNDVLVEDYTFSNSIFDFN